MGRNDLKVSPISSTHFSHNNCTENLRTKLFEGVGLSCNFG